MALIPCPESDCGNRVSDSAPKCPRCGARIKCPKCDGKGAGPMFEVGAGKRWGYRTQFTCGACNGSGFNP